MFKASLHQLQHTKLALGNMVVYVNMDWLSAMCWAGDKKNSIRQQLREKLPTIHSYLRQPALLGWGRAGLWVASAVNTSKWHRGMGQVLLAVVQWGGGGGQRHTARLGKSWEVQRKKKKKNRADSGSAPPPPKNNPFSSYLILKLIHSHPFSDLWYMLHSSQVTH